MMEEQTKWGVPVVYKNIRENVFVISPFGDVQRIIMDGFTSIDQVEEWVREKGGALGTVKEHFFLGRYREVYLPGYISPLEKRQ